MAAPPTSPTASTRSPLPSPTVDFSTWPSGRQQGRQAFADALRLVIGQAHQTAATEMFLCDPDFADWPLGERAVVEALDAWCLRGRSVRLLAHHYDTVIRSHARLVRWRGLWSHQTEARGSRQVRAVDFPSALVIGPWALWRVDADHGVFLSGVDTAMVQSLKERLAQLWSQSAPAFPSTTLGL